MNYSVMGKKLSTIGIRIAAVITEYENKKNDTASIEAKNYTSAANILSKNF